MAFSYISFSVPPEKHRKIKVQCAIEGKQITQKLNELIDDWLGRVVEE